MMAKLIAFVSSFIAIFLVIGMAAYFRYYGPAGGLLHPDPDAASVVRQVRELRDLATAHCAVETLLTRNGTLLRVRGKVTAQVNLNDFTQYNVVSIKGRAVVIRMPAPQITETQTNTPEAVEAIRTAALQMGILDDARRNAESAVRKFLTSSGFAIVTFL